MSAAGEDIDVIELAASQWAVRSQDDAFSEADVTALVLWLEESPLHARAYDQAMRLWTRLDSLRDMPQSVVSLDGRRRRDPMKFHLPAWGVGGAIAAALAVAAVMVTWPAPSQIYQTARGERKTVTLADGSVLMLNTGTQVSVRLGRFGRQVTLDHGEVALKVTHDAARPLTLLAGDTRVTDIGTDFDVLRDGGTVKVAVREGEVALGTGEHLHAGDLSLHNEGATGSTVTRTNLDEAFAWQTAHAIYRNQPLSVVVRDLNRYFDKPLVVDEDSGKLRLTAILTLDSETSVVGRLQAFLPLDARATENGVLLTRSAKSRRGREL